MKGWIFLLLSGFYLYSEAQQTISINRTYRPTHEQESEMVFLYYPYHSNILDLSHFRNVFPASRLELQEKIVILPPDLSQLQDTVYGITYFPPEKNRPGKMVIIIIGNYKSDSPIYFIDYNLDRNYANDGPPFVFRNEPYTTLKFSNNQHSDNPYILRLLNPGSQKEIKPDDLKNPRATRRDLKNQQTKPEVDSYQRYTVRYAEEMRASSHVGLRVLASVDFGSVKYDFAHGQTGYPTRFLVDFNTKGISAQATYRLGKFKLGAVARYENIFYWSSTKSTRLGDPFFACDDNGACKWYNNVKYEFNTEILPRNRFSYGASAEYAFRISRFTYVLPYATALIHAYTGTGFIPSRYQDPEKHYPMGFNPSLEGGLMLVSDINRSMSFVAGVHAANLGFKPRGYFDQFSPQNLLVTNRQAGVSLGFQIRVE
ncbi:MAG: hypothetical protein R3C61_25220 [Bacteroidia bacterium]